MLNSIGNDNNWIVKSYFVIATLIVYLIAYTYVILPRYPNDDLGIN